MINFSFSEKLVQLKDIVMSSPFFFVSLIIGIVLLIIMILGIKKNRRINKIIFIVAWLFVLIFCIVRYHNFFLSIFDRLLGRIVEEIYFPSLSVYTFILLFTNIIFVYSLLNKKLSNLFRITNLALSMEIDFLFILILDTIMKNNIDIYSDLDIYINPKLLVLLEFSMFIFVIWLLVIIVMYFVKKYAVKKVFVSTFKEGDYEVLDIPDDTLKSSNLNAMPILNDQVEILDLEDNSTVNDNIEIVEL